MESQQIVLKVLDDAIQRHASDIYFLPHRDGHTAGVPVVPPGAALGSYVWMR